MDRYAVDSGSTSAGVFIRSSMAGIRARPRVKAEAHAIRNGGRSPRVAKQFIELLKAEV